MNPDDIARILDELGQRLGPAGSYVFELAVRQQLIEGWTVLIVFLLSSTVLVVALLRWNKAFDPDAYQIPPGAYVAAIALFLAGVSGFGLLVFGLGKLLNPEYAAIRDILSRLVPA